MFAGHADGKRGSEDSARRLTFPGKFVAMREIEQIVRDVGYDETKLNTKTFVKVQIGCIMNKIFHFHKESRSSAN